MDWDAIGAIGEIVGALAVGVTLLYLARQTKVSGKATVSASRSASAVALKSSKALEITPAILQEVNQQDPAQFTLLHINMGRQVSRRLRRLDDMVFRTFMAMSLIGSTSDDLV